MFLLIFYIDVCLILFLLDELYALVERVEPMRDFYIVCISDFSLVKHAVVRAWSLVGIVFGQEWLYIAGCYAVEMMYGYCKVIPAADAFVREVVYSRYE